MRISLHNLSQAELSKREENLLRGGDGIVEGGQLPCVCIAGCSCLYEGEKEGPDDAYYGGSPREECFKLGDSDYRFSGDKG